MTIRHCVLVRFKPNADVLKIFTELKANSPEGLQRGHSHGFTVDFRDAKSRDAYLSHPEHQKVGGMIVAAAEGGIDGVTVLDWVI
jgi:Stress responsive A/B Barrel Domain